ncbi:phage portal protein [Amycolatopsis sp. CA-128772]|uniref:phage portal protein n=1 Tax=Amycolatopsis sp. CA-128772 TaxID=2073159 RepID=UPI001304E233|nr:phage portal protein [Amycolatopsis sp. CA-128772]
MPARVQGLADVTPIFADASYYATDGLSLLNQFAAYGELYRRQLWIGVLVRKLAFGTARLPYRAYAITDAGTEQLADNDPLVSLLARPNDQLDAFRLWLWTSATYDVYGEAYWLKLRDDRGRVRELQPMHPANVIIRRDELGELVYFYSAGVRDVSLLPPIPAADVVPFTAYNPDTLVRGLSTLEGLRETLYSEDAARRATASFWRRGARPSIALTHPATLSKPAQDRLQATWDSNHTGADLMGGTAILEEGLTPHVLQLSAEEMQYVETRKLNREEVCAAYDVPPPVVHILDRATYSNVTEQMRSMYRDTMAPRLNMFESAVAHHLVPDFDRSGKTVAKFDLDEVLRGDFETRSTAVRELISSGVMMPAEARPLFNLNPAGPEAAQLFGNAALVPLGSNATPPGVDDQGNALPRPAPTRRPPALPAGEGQADDGAGQTRAYDLRSLAGRLGRVKGQRDALRSRLADEHRAAISEYFGRQGTAVQAALATKDASGLDAAYWAGELATLFGTLGDATARMLGAAVAQQLGADDYDPATLAAWIAAGAKVAARGVTDVTERELARALTDASDPAGAARDYFGGLDGRAEQLAATRVTVVGGMAEHEAAAWAGAHTKTWHAGRHPRVSHEAMDGETARMGARFSNGMTGPGDPAGGADECAGCNCYLTFTGE